METTFQSIVTWIKTNWIISIFIALVGIVLFFPNMFKPARRRKRRVVNRTVVRKKVTLRNRTLPRAVGVSSKGYPAAAGGYIPFKYNKDGTIKKAWQVGGTVAAKSRMRRLRKAK